MRFRRGPGNGMRRWSYGRVLPWLVVTARRQPALVWVAAAVVPAVVGYLVAVLVLFPAPIFAATRSVPRVIGQSLTEAREALERAGLDVEQAEAVPHPRAPRGTVIWQDPPAKTSVPEGTTVRLGVSAGAQRVPVPDLTGYDVELARQLIEAAGLRVDRVDATQAPVPRNVVVNTRPPAGTPLGPNGAVTLVVSVGAPTITVPSLAGLTLDEARAALEEAGLTLGEWYYRTTALGSPGTIFRQTPDAGTLSAPGTAVNVVVARRRR